MRLIGEASYSIYLIHILLIYRLVVPGVKVLQRLSLDRSPSWVHLAPPYLQLWPPESVSISWPRRQKSTSASSANMSTHLTDKTAWC